jgi:hypothetical protein
MPLHLTLLTFLCSPCFADGGHIGHALLDSIYPVFSSMVLMLAINTGRLPRSTEDFFEMVRGGRQFHHFTQHLEGFASLGNALFPLPSEVSSSERAPVSCLRATGAH